MPAILDEKALSLFGDPNARKALSTVGSDGRPHTVFKESLHVGPDGNIRYYELMESSRSNANLTYSMWFHRPVSISVAGSGDISYQIIGTPVRAIISGREFEEAYVSVRESLGGDADLSTIWVIEPNEVREETLCARLREEAEKHPRLGHLDRYVKAPVLPGANR